MLGGVLADPAGWCGAPAASGLGVNVEFAGDPTGPLTMEMRARAFGVISWCRAPEGGGQRVTRVEHHCNDFMHVEKLLIVGALAIVSELDDGYHGTQRRPRGQSSRRSSGTPPAGQDPATAPGLGRFARHSPGVARDARLHFDVWRSESTLHKDGWVAKAIDQLRAAGDYTRRTARSSSAPPVRGRQGPGRPSLQRRRRPYFAADIGYLVEKFSRGYQHIVYIWGADHHGTVAR